MKQKRLTDYLKDQKMIEAINKLEQYEKRRYASGDYNISDYTGHSGEI